MLGSPPPRVTAPADLRRLNLVRVLNCLRDRGSASRSELAAATGLVKGSITGLVGVLLAEGLLRELDDAPRRGRSAPSLAIDGSSRAVLAVELTVDRFTVFCCDLAERPIFDEDARHRGARADPEQIADVGAALIRRALDVLAERGLRLERAVFVVAAPVFGDGHVPISVDLGWTDVDLGRLFRLRLPELTCPLSFVGDARMGGWAEYQHLRRTGSDELADLLYLKSGTGIGGIVVARGEILTGAHDMAFVPGHMVVDTDGELCGCGQRGCLVTVAGPEFVVSAAGLADLLAEHGVTSAVTELLARADAGDPDALAALTSAGEWLGRFLNLSLIGFDPGLIVLGGYWSPAIEYLLAGIERTFNPFAPGAHEVYSAAMIRPAALGERANLIGAVDLAIRTTFENLAAAR